MNIAIWLASGLVTAVAMELWAALLHGKIWHGLLWFIHASHHRRRIEPLRERVDGWEANDALSTLHAPIAVALILYGCTGAPSSWRELAFGIGLGMTAFGLAYVIVHDGFAHGRLPGSWLLRALFLKWGYMKRVRAAHMVHHNGGGEEPYGLFLGPLTIRRVQSRRRSSAMTARPKP
ncbi:MAG: sterol desaturase family protein [Clostridia bacterium]|nr:sterol desaturase family protein [Deltaproteobacteria bacterium]